MDNPFEQKFHDKFETIAEEFGIPFSRLSDLLGLSKNSIYALRKSNSWKPQTSWYLDKIKRLDHVRDLLLEYKQFAIYSTKGKLDKFDTDMYFQWTFSLWWNMKSRDDYIVVSPIPPSPIDDEPVVVGPPKPKTKIDIFREQVQRSADDLLDLAKNPIP